MPATQIEKFERGARARGREGPRDSAEISFAVVDGRADADGRVVGL